ncbi:MAG: pyridoxamine 5'-phosphate oxidase [Myxococcota bacterium]
MPRDHGPVADPIARFREIQSAAAARAAHDPTLVALATADAEGRPSVRYVLLKDVDAEGRFVFFTNYTSRKGRELEANPHAALAFHWFELGVQVRVEGTVVRAPAAVSDAYFAARPRGSRIGAWASPQSQPIEDRDTLLARVRDTEARHPGDTIPRPSHWGGYQLTPSAVELWYDGQFRLHDRFRYERAGSEGWRATRLAP